MSRVQGRFSAAERDAVYRAIFERRDVRKNFLPTPISEPVMTRLLSAAHHAGSVGFMQPWDFVVIRNAATKRAVKGLFVEANTEAARRYTGPKGDLYRRLKLEGIEEAPVNLCITCSRRRGGRDVLGRSTVRAMDLYSTCCAVQNLWLAARAEGIGVGWVSILDHEALKRVVGVPKSVTILAYLCLGYVSKFEPAPDLETAGWRNRIPVSRLIHYDAWGNQDHEEERDEYENHEGVHQNGRRGKDKTRRRPTGVEGQSSSRGLRHRR
ncbi:MAG TPA: 5,6-dimethylbenzimidazole synthase [Nitrospira sp.]|nr:5,6-dimethylbenzimidazole synthase [Nitrospira sp.]